MGKIKHQLCFIQKHWKGNLIRADEKSLDFSVDLSPTWHSVLIPNYAFSPWKPSAFQHWTLIIYILWKLGNCQNIVKQRWIRPSCSWFQLYSHNCITSHLRHDVSWRSWKYSRWLKGFILFSKINTNLFSGPEDFIYSTVRCYKPQIY